MDEQFAYVGGKVVPVEEAVVSVSDRGVIYGDGLYETIRAKSGECVRLALHLDRLFTGARTLGFPDDLSKLDFASAVAEVLEANSLSNARVRVTVTRGRNSPPGGMGLASATQPTVIITADPLIEVEPQPCRVVITSYRRDETSPLANVKTLNCLPSVMAYVEAKQAGASDAILLNTQGNVSEGATANIFVVTGSLLTTPSLDQGCLAGTVRSAVLGLASHLGLEVSESPVHPEVLNDADEVFFTSAIRLVRPIGAIDGRTVGSGGKVWRLIREALLRAERCSSPEFPGIP